MTIKEMVREVLESDKATQHDNRLLLFAVWEKEGLPMPPLETILRLSQPETIRRHSRKIMND